MLGKETSGNHQAYRRGHLDITILNDFFLVVNRCVDDRFFKNGLVALKSSSTTPNAEQACALKDFLSSFPVMSDLKNCEREDLR